MPYIYSVEVKRSIPGTVIINVTETKDKFAVQNNKKYVLLDDNFKVLNSASESRAESTVLITGAKIKSAQNGTVVQFEKSEMQERLSKLAAAIKIYKIDNVTGISSENANANKMVYDNRIVINFKDAADLEARIYHDLA